MKSSIIITILSIFLVSCVGTVEDAKLKLNDLFNNNEGALSFEGITEARPISHNKIEVEFYPTALTDPNIKYLLYINDTNSPIEISPSSLDDANGGRKRYLVNNLTMNTTYKFKVRIKNMLTLDTSSKEREMTAKTFDNRTSDFLGITSLRKTNGQSDTSIRIDWLPAKMEGTTQAGAYDPYYYEVMIIGAGGPQNLNNNSYTGSDKIGPIRVPQDGFLSPLTYTQEQYNHLVRGGLTPNTKYYVQVRAISKIYATRDPSSPPVSTEVNTKFLSISTDPATGFFDFNPESLQARAGTGSTYKNRVNLSWIPASGSFLGYRLFYIPCTGPSCTDEANVLANDLLTNQVMDDLAAGNTTSGGAMVGTTTIGSALSSFPLTGLSGYTWYQFKLVACKNSICDRNTGGAITSVLRAARTSPLLASFSGIVKIEHPDSAESTDQITVRFDPPYTVSGFANRLEFYCIRPSSVTPAQTNMQFVKLSETAEVTNATNAPDCNGIRLCGPDAENCDDDSLVGFNIASTSSIRIKGIKTGTNYCFAAFPAIRGEIEEVPSLVSPPTTDWIIRCISPEIRTPTIAQFPGLNPSCVPNLNTIPVSWEQPTSGIYEGYRVFWRRISNNEPLSFSAATADVASGTINTVNSPYMASPMLDKNTLNYTIQNLRPGVRYKVGVLTQTSGTPIAWSEFNINIRECVTPMPTFKFKEWTRVFAIGPKTDGRYPILRDGATTSFKINPFARIYEALNHDGIPYELNLTTSTPPNGDTSTGFVKPPGHYGVPSYDPTTFTADFDGAQGAYGGNLGTLVNASNQGIISLAWKDVDLSYTAAQNEFVDCQISATETLNDNYCHRDNLGNIVLPNAKNKRRYGYKVFRSADNRLTWKDVTTPPSGSDNSSGSYLIYSKDFSYYKKDFKADFANGSNIVTTERMAFFTDYSVESIVTDPTVNGKARVYWYKIVPYFDNRPVALGPEQASAVVSANIVKVILPPANMALVHRNMANRQTCMEIGRDSENPASPDYMDRDKFYTCSFNGFGAKPLGSPWNMAKTGIDLGGHLLVDRHELGCSFTRGDIDANPVDQGNSFFKKTDPTPGMRSNLPQFKGLATDTNGVEITSRPFRGCAASDKTDYYLNLDGRSSDPSTDTSSDYRKFTHGDCTGGGIARVSTSSSPCLDPTIANYVIYSFPGMTYPEAASTSTYDCSTGTAIAPTTSAMFADPFLKNILIQSEFAAVYHHRTIPSGSDSKVPNPQGPNGNTVIHSGGVLEDWAGRPASCFINLASIGPTTGDPKTSNTWTARWYSVGDLEIIKEGAGSKSIIKRTLAQVTTDPELFNGTNYISPSGGQLNDQRIKSSSVIGRIISSPAAKLPPITNLSQTAAQALCETYSVDIGYSTDGLNFLPLTSSKQKRLLTRRELVVAGAWSDSANNGLPENFDWNNTNIFNLESGTTQAGYCVTPNKTTTETISSPAHKAAMRATMPGRGFANSSARKGLLFSGSSNNDGTTHSKLCISRWGIQDIIGNAEEISTERLFCDYGQDQIYFGGYSGGAGDPTLSVRAPNYDGTFNDFEFYSSVTKILREVDDGNGGVTVEQVLGNNGRMWVDNPPGSGYCSIVDTSDPGSNYSNLWTRYRDNSGNFWGIFNPDGTINTNIIGVQNPIYQAGVNNSRNGDGYLLNFGANSPGPAVRFGNSLAVSDNGVSVTSTGAALGPYFNPVLGLPMNCQDPVCSGSPDNMMASTNYFLNVPAAPKPADTTIPPFPLGNSNIYSIGISQMSKDGTPYTPDYSDPKFAAVHNELGTRVITSILIRLNGSLSYTKMSVQDWMNSPDFVGQPTWSQARFALPRNTFLTLLHGGGTGKLASGRFTASYVDGSRVELARNNANNSARCGVLIEE